MARIGNFSREINLLVSNRLSVPARQRLVAKYARKVLGEAQGKHFRLLGRTLEYNQIVDGRLKAPLESVNPDRGTIVFEFSLIEPLLRFIGEQLVLHSPIKTGQYSRSHLLLADGVEADVSAGIPKADDYLFVNVVPYARKIERGQSSQAPEGVYRVVADMARRRFGNMAKIKFTYASITGPYVALGGRRAGRSASVKTREAHRLSVNTRNPAIRVTWR